MHRIPRRTGRRSRVAEPAGDASEPTPLAGPAHGRALGTRRDEFSPVGVWSAVAVILLACAGVGIGIIVSSWWVVGGATAVLLAASGAAWAFGILNDTR